MLHTPQTAATAAQFSPASFDELTAALDPVVPIYVLIDPMLGEPVPAEDSRDEWARDIAPVNLHASVALQPQLHPYLIALEGIDDPLLETTLAIAHGERTALLDAGLGGHGGAAHRICGWLQSSMHADQLAEQLATMFRVNTEARTTATYLRLLDRRVLALWRHVVGDARAAGQLGRLQSWTYLTPLGGLATLRSAAEEAKPVRMSKAEWDQMQEGEAIHRTIRQWLGELELMGIAPHTEEAALYDWSREALRDAFQAALRWPHRFKELQDETTWAVLSMMHPGLARMATVGALMQEPGTPQAPAEQMKYAYVAVHALALDELAKH